jgi:hypothetical protein
MHLLKRLILRNRLVHTLPIILKVTMIKYICYVLLSFFLFHPSTVIADDSSELSQVVRVESRDGRLSVEAEGVRLFDILTMIARESGFEHVFHGSLDTPLTISFHDVPLIDGIRRIVGGNFVILLEEKNNGNESMVKVLEVWDPVKYTAGREVSADNRPVTDRILSDFQSANRIRRLNAIDMASQEDKSSAIGVLITVLKDDVDPMVRVHAVKAIARIGGEESVMAMATALGDDEVAVRQQVVEALDSNGSDRAIQIHEACSYACFFQKRYQLLKGISQGCCRRL